MIIWLLYTLYGNHSSSQLLNSFQARIDTFVHLPCRSCAIKQRKDLSMSNHGPQVLQELVPWGLAAKSDSSISVFVCICKYVQCINVSLCVLMVILSEWYWCNEISPCDINVTWIRWAAHVTGLHEAHIRLSSGWWFRTFFIVHFIYGMSSFPLTNNSIIFQRG